MDGLIQAALGKIKDTAGQLFNQAPPVQAYNNIQRIIQSPQVQNTVKQQIVPQIQSFASQGQKILQGYSQQVQANQKTPFFNNTDNTPLQWLGKVGQDVQKRGAFEGLQDLTYPVLMNPYIEPLTEPITGAARMANYKAGRPNPLVNSLLGQTDSQMSGAANAHNGIGDLVNTIGQQVGNQPINPALPFGIGQALPQVTYGQVGNQLKQNVQKSVQGNQQFYQGLSPNATPQQQEFSRNNFDAFIPMGGVEEVGANTVKKIPLKGAAQAISKQMETASNLLKERKFITSVRDGEKTPQAIKDIISGDYLPKSFPQLQKDARKLIKADPMMAEKLANNPLNDTHIQIGNELLDHYYATGQLDKAKNLAQSMANSGTEFGRAVQAFANYDKTTPSGAVKFAQSKVNEYNRLNPTKKLSITNDQIKNLFDTAKNIQAMAEGRERNIASHQLMEQVNNLIPSSIADKAVTLWKAGLLTSLRTHERNLLGNTIHGVAEIAKDLPATLADKAMSLRTGQRTQTFTLKGFGSGAKKGMQGAADMLTKGFDPEDAITKFDIRRVTWGNNKIEQGLKKYTDAVFRTLGAEDKPFYSAAFGRSLYDQAGAEAINAGKQGDAKFIESLVSKPTSEMLQAATKDAETATFHEKTKLSKLAGAIQDYRPAGIPVGHVLAPFTGVPSAIAGQMVNYSPIGLAKGVLKAGKVTVKNVPEFQRQAAQEIGRGVIGTGIFGLGAYLMSKGLMTGQPKDQAQQAQWQLENKPANSILVGGQWRSINSIGVEALVALAGAKAAEEMGKPDGSLGNYAGNIGKDFLGQTFLQGVQQPLAAISDPARYGQSYVGNQVSSVVPNLVKDTAKAFDGSVRENNNVQDYVTNAIPGMRNNNVEKRDALGNVIPQEPTGAGAFLDLFSSKTPTNDNPVVNELSTLDKGGNNATPGALKKDQTINGEKMTLTPQQLNTLEAQVGTQATQAIADMIKTPDYQSLNDEDKAKAIESIVTSVRKQVRGTIDLNSGSLQVAPTSTTNTAGMNGSYTLVNPQTGTVKRVDLSNAIPAPTMTGVQAIDKIALSKYTSALTTRSNDIYELFKAGKITQDQAAKALTDLGAAKLGTKKPKKLRIKVSSARVPKAKAFKSKKIKMAKVKVPKFLLKSSKTTV